MATVAMTPHLYRYFPQLEQISVEVEAGSVAHAIQQLEQQAPGFSSYVLDDHGALRRHVMISIDDNLLVDRKGLSDLIGAESTLYIFQALSGG